MNIAAHPLLTCLPCHGRTCPPRPASACLACLVQPRRAPPLPGLDHQTSPRLPSPPRLALTRQPGRVTPSLVPPRLVNPCHAPPAKSRPDSTHRTSPGLPLSAKPCHDLPGLDAPTLPRLPCQALTRHSDTGHACPVASRRDATCPAGTCPVVPCLACLT